MTESRDPNVEGAGHRGLLAGLLMMFLICLAAPARSFAEDIPLPSHMDVRAHPSRENVFLVMGAEKTSVYLHEIVPVFIRLYSRGVNLKDIQYPRLSHESFSIQEFESPLEKRETINGVVYDIVEFKTNLFAKKTGELMLGPARLGCEVQIGKGERDFLPPGNRDAVDSYFGAAENVSLDVASQHLLFQVNPLPEKGKPADFEGAVGQFRFTAEVTPREVRLGETIVLRIRIQGKGNFQTVTAPRIEKGMGFKTYGPHTRQEPELKVYEQVLIPQSDAVKEVPRIRFVFFEPERRGYRILYEGPFPINVTRADGGKEQKMGPAAGTTAGDLISIKESPGRLRKKRDFIYSNKAFLIIQLLPFLLFISLFFIHRHQERLRTDVRYAMRLEARKRARRGVKQLEKSLKKENSIAFYNSLFKTFQGYLGNRLCLSPGGITGAVVEDVLKPKGLDEETLRTLETIFNECDQIRYASSTLGKRDMEKTFHQTQEVIRYLENQPL